MAGIAQDVTAQVIVVELMVEQMVALMVVQMAALMVVETAMLVM